MLFARWKDTAECLYTMKRLNVIYGGRNATAFHATQQYLKTALEQLEGFLSGKKKEMLDNYILCKLPFITL